MDLKQKRNLFLILLILWYFLYPLTVSPLLSLILPSQSFIVENASQIGMFKSYFLGTIDFYLKWIVILVLLTLTIRYQRLLTRKTSQQTTTKEIPSNTSSQRKVKILFNLSLISFFVGILGMPVLSWFIDEGKTTVPYYIWFVINTLILLTLFISTFSLKKKEELTKRIALIIISLIAFFISLIFVTLFTCRGDCGL